MTRNLLVVLSLLFVCLTSCKSDGTRQKTTSGNVDLNFDVATEVPQLTDHFQIVGVDEDGKVVYGPIYLPKSDHVMLTGVPSNVANLQITYLLGNTPIGMVNAPVDLSQGSATVDLGPMQITTVERLTSLTISPTTAQVAVDGVQDFHANGSFSDGSSYDLTSLVNWSSASPTVASIDGGGRAKGLTAGTSAITASLLEVTSQAAALTVTPPVQPVLLPAVFSVTPATGPNLGGTAVTIAGTNLRDTTSVSFGATAAASFTVISDAQINAVTPSNASGKVHVQVSTPSGTSVLSAADEFSYHDVPTVLSVIPNKGARAGGETIVIAGSAFSGTTGVSIGGNPASSFKVDSDTQITAVTPPGAGSGFVQVTTNNGMSSTGTASGYRYLPMPVLSTVNPGNGPIAGGNPVVLTGSDLEQITEVRFGGSIASFTIVSATEIAAVAPAGTGVIRVTLKGPGGTSTGLDYAYLPIPALTSLEPSSGAAAGGNTVMLTGSGLADATAVSFGAMQATSFEVVSDTELTAVAPAGTGVVRVTVSTPGGKSNGIDYTFAAPPSATSIAPASGPEAGGNPVTVIGTGFTDASAVHFGSTAASNVHLVSDSELTADAPAGTGAVGVTVTTAGGTTAPVSYTYQPIPALTDLVPSAGPVTGNTLITVIGSGFTGATAVNFDGTPGTSLTVISDTQLSVVAPAGPAGVEVVDVTVVTPGGTSNYVTYAYVPLPALSAVSPTAGPETGGNPVLLTGSEFTKVVSVKFGSAPSPGFTILSATQIEAIAPPGTGDVAVTVVSAGGTSGSQLYTYAPGPSLIDLMPSSGPLAGGNTVELIGGDFNGTSAVSFGATPAASFTVVSAGQIDAVAPAGTGTVEVSVTAAGGTSNVLPYSFVPPPELTALDPDNGLFAGGELVTLTGTNLSAASAVRFGATPATSFTITSATQIIAMAPPGEGVVDVEVTTPGGTSEALPYTYAAATLLDGIAPASGPVTGGNTVTLFGSGLANATGVDFGSAEATFTVVDDEELTVVAPPGTGTVQVTVQTPFGVSESVPYVYRVRPTSGTLDQSAGPLAGGGTLTIGGTDLTGASAVTFGTTPATSFTILNDTTITAVIPAGTGSVLVTVTTPGGISEGASYTYAPIPTLDSLSPSAGPRDGGGSVTLTGGGLAGATLVSFGGANATFSIVSNTEIQAIAPPGIGNVDVRVTTPGGITSSLSYRYAGPPVLTAVSPSSGPLAGTNSVILTGSDLTGASEVTFGGVAATSFTIVSDSEIQATTPAGSGIVDVRVVTPGGSATAADSYSYRPVPTISSPQPSSGPQAGGNTITISGSGFVTTSAVTFGSTPATSFLVVSDTALSVLVPPGSGSVDVTITTAGGTSSASSYTYAPVPTLTSLSPEDGPLLGGGSITITGAGFTGATEVRFGATPASFSIASDTQIFAMAPTLAAGASNVTVTTPGGASNALTYTSLIVPTLSAIVPIAGPVAGATSVTLTGSGLATTESVTFGGLPATFSVSSDSQIVAVAPAGSGLVDIALTTRGGAALLPDAYTYVPAPTIVTLSPIAGPVSGGNTIAITGAGLAGASAVTFDGVPGIILSAQPTQLSVSAPAGSAGDAIVEVSNVGGTSLSLTYTYVSEPELVAITPAAGPEVGGNTVTLEGVDLTLASAVFFGSTPATSFTVVDDGEISAVVPAGLGVSDVSVLTPGGTITSPGAYTYVAAPVVASVTPGAGPYVGGIPVTINGTGFTGATAVSFGSNGATFTVVSDTQITATSPAGSGLVDVSVSSVGGSATLAYAFGYRPVPTISGPTPSSGPVAGGTTITIEGTGFTGASAVTFGGSPATSYTVVSDTLIVATTPAGSGTVTVTVTAPGGTSDSSYTYAPVPALSSVTPSDGPWVGGSVITLNGQGFTGASAVTFGPFPALAYSVLSDTQISATVPPLPGGSVNLVVTSAGGSSNALGYTALLPPSISTILPSAGPIVGGTSVTITGVGLATTTALSFGGAVASFTVDSDSQVTAVAPAGTGYADVVLTTRGGSATAVAAYAYVPAPLLAAIVPNAGPLVGGNTAYITGLLGTVLGVNFDGVPGVITSTTPTQLTVIVPAGSEGSANVEVINVGGTSPALTYTYTAEPTITGINPARGPQAGGNTVTIEGSDFDSAGNVYFGAQPASFTVVDDSEISAVAPAGIGVVDVSVVAAGGTALELTAYRYVPAPILNAISPNAGPLAGGSSVTLTGVGFDDVTNVSFGGNAASFTIDSDTQITVTTPAGSGYSDVVVTSAGGSVTAVSAFNYLAASTVGSLSATSGPLAGGNLVILNGSGFATTTGVNFGSTPAASYSVLSDTQISAVAPAGAGTVAVYATTAGGAGTGASYSYAPVPALTSVSPSSGAQSGGGSISLTGSGLSGATSVTIGAVATSFTVVSDTQISATLPFSGGAGPTSIVVTTPGGTSNAATYTYLAPPTFSSVLPTGGPLTGGNSVVIIGTGFTTTTGVTFDGSAATSYTVDADNQISAVVPAGTGVVDIVITTGGGSATGAGAYQYVTAPVLAAISPSAGPVAGGNTVLITGIGLGSATDIEFDGVAGIIVATTPTQLTAVVPTGAEGTADVDVTNAGGTSAPLTYTYVEAPVISSLAPTTGPGAGGTAVTINGSELTDVDSVFFDGTPATSFTILSDSQISATTPAGTAGAVDVVVVSPGGSATAAGGYTYLAAPAITSFTPSSGSPAGGTSVTISGSGFTGATGVSFGGVAATSFTVTSPTQITAVTPPGTGSGAVAVTGPGGTGSGGSFTFAATPVLTSLSPTSGPAGTLVTLTGSGFTGATGVTFGFSPATFTVISDTQITATATAPFFMFTSGAVSVTTPLGTSNAISFTYPPVPSLSSVVPATGPDTGGTAVTITGSGLSGATAVTFGGTPAASFTVLSATSISAVTPARSPGIGIISVTTPGGVSNNVFPIYFNFVSPP